jgi:hypothetical protein
MKKSLIVSLLVILIGIGIYLIINQTNTSNSAQNLTPAQVSVDTNSNSQLPAKQSVAQSDQTPKQETIQLTSTSIDPKAVAEGWRVVALGSTKVSEDSNDFSVPSITDLGQTIVPDQALWGYSSAFGHYMTRTTEGKFIQVDFKVNNTSLEDESMELVPDSVFDQDNRAYGSLLVINVCGSNTSLNYTIYAQNLKPSIPCTMKALYEVSQDSKTFVAKLFYRKGK